MLNQFSIVLPEIMLATLAILMQVAGAIYKKSSRMISIVTIMLALGICGYLLFGMTYHSRGFADSFLTSGIVASFKAVILGISLMSIVVYYDFVKISQTEFCMEFVTLVLFSTLGIFIAISARDFILLFCGLELQALSGYALAAFNNKDVRSSEAGLKYFVLGALMSSLMLLGISFLYGFSGSIKFTEVSAALNGEFNIGLVVGTIFVLAALLFKLSAAPLHIWAPDVYEGAPISSVSYFATAQKLGVLVILITYLNETIGDYSQISEGLIKIVAIFSMVIGSLGALGQQSLKRLMAYSSILNIGYVLIGVSLPSEAGSDASLMYMLIYIIGVIGFFACLVALFGSKSDVVTFEDLKGIASQRKTIAASIAIIMFSMIGLPPLAGFFGKYAVFYQAVLQGEVTLAMLGVLTSVIAAFYYLKVVKYMYFMDADKAITIIPTHKGLWLVTVMSVGFTLLFLVYFQR